MSSTGRDEAFKEAAALLRQDILDGAALRRLLDAMPPAWSDPLVTIQWYRFEDGAPTWNVSPQDAGAEPSSVDRTGRGETLAEAADASREKLP